jgi:hypothetical protein
MTKAMVTTLAIFLPTVSADTTEIPRWAQEKTPVKVMCYLGIGTSYPLEEIGDSWKQGFHGFGRLDFLVSPKLSVWVGADYHFFSPEDVADTSVEGGKFWTINFTGDLKIDPGTLALGINPYLFAGLGLAIQSISDFSYRIYGDTLVNRGLINYPTKSIALIEIGGGVEYKNFFVQGRFLRIMFDDISGSYIPVTVGVKF